MPQPLRPFQRKPRASLQLGPVDCGPANLRALALQQGIRVDNHRIRRLCGTNRAGTSVLRLRDAAESMGYQTEVRPLDLFDLMDHPEEYLPAIVPLETGAPLLHFVTLYGFRGRRAIVMDPQHGTITEDFQALWRRLHRMNLRLPAAQILSEDRDPANCLELEEALVRWGVDRARATAWLERHGAFRVDDTMKFARLLSLEGAAAQFGGRQKIVESVLESASLALPPGFGTGIERGPAPGDRARLRGTLVLTVRGSPREDLTSDRAAAELRLLGLVPRLIRLWGPFAVTSVVLAALGIGFSLATGQVVGSLESGWPPFIPLIAGLGTARALQIFFGYAQSRGLNRIRRKTLLAARSGILERLHRVPEWVVADRVAGELVARVEEGDALSDFVIGWPAGVLVSGLSVLAAMALLTQTFWPFLAVALIQALLSWALVELFSHRLKALARDSLENAAKFRARMFEALRGIEALRLTCAPDHSFAEVDSAAAVSTTSSLRLQTWMLLQSSMLSGLGIVSFAAMTWLGYDAIAGKHSETSAVVTALALTGMAQGALGQLVRQRQALRTTAVVLDRFDELAETDTGDASTRPLMNLVEDAPVVSDDWLRFSVERAHFAYGNESPLLQDLSFDVTPGQHVCLMGTSGVGKSSLFSLMSGLYLPEQGTIALDGHDVTGLRAREWGVVLVEQSATLIDDTLESNVLLGSPHPGEEALMRIARITLLDAVVSRLPEGWQSRVGGRWPGLSGGEMRRVLLARALLRRPKILLLDETLGMVDWRHRRRILTAIRTECPRLAVVASSHDPTDAVLFDRAVILSNGRVFEDGATRDLLRNPDSLLFRLVRTATPRS